MYTKSRMITQIEVKDILSRNRLIDPNQLAEILRIIKELRASGIRGESHYNLISPFTTHKPGHFVSKERHEESKVSRCS